MRPLMLHELVPYCVYSLIELVEAFSNQDLNGCTIAEKQRLEFVKFLVHLHDPCIYTTLYPKDNDKLAKLLIKDVSYQSYSSDYRYQTSEY